MKHEKTHPEIDIIDTVEVAKQIQVLLEEEIEVIEALANKISRIMEENHVSPIVGTLAASMWMGTVLGFLKPEVAPVLMTMIQESCLRTSLFLESGIANPENPASRTSHADAIFDDLLGSP